MTGDNVRDVIAEAIANAECEQRPKCVWCMTMSVVAELDGAGMIVVSAADYHYVLDRAEQFAMHRFDADDSVLVARLRAALPERNEP